ncbi:MAG: CBS domain-containing protein [Propionibacteriaceae bacterium]|nr:CBS domain-containing protein [Propionibacteriaceae bacterium]
MLDPNGDQVGKIRDVVIQASLGNRPPHVKGFVVELLAMRRIFFPMERVRSISVDQVIVSGLVNTRRFEKRDQEVLVINGLFDQAVTRKGSPQPVTIFDVAIRRSRAHDWELSEVALRDAGNRRPFQKGHVTIVDWSEVQNLLAETPEHSAEDVVARLREMKPADVARELHDMEPTRRSEVLAVMEDRRLADALEELPEDEQADLITQLDPERAADILEEMAPDDAADLMAVLDSELAEVLLEKMQPEDADDVRTLLSYDSATAGGLMNPEPVLLPADATVADALASVRREEITPAMAALAFVCRSPLETPTGRYLGAVHIQRLLREPPSALVATLIDSNVTPLPPDSPIAVVSRYFATYDMVCAPVVDSDHRLLGAVTVDDVLDHILPDDWRGIQLDFPYREVRNG